MIWRFIKRNKVLTGVALLYLAAAVFSPEKAAAAVDNSIYYLIEMIQVMPVVFMLVVSIDVLVSREAIIKGLGKNSGIKGTVLSFLMGSLSAGPIYAAFPVCKALLAKGAGIKNIVMILSAWAVIKVPMLLNEVKFLGVRFMAIRWVLTVAAIILMAKVMASMLKEKDMAVDLRKGSGDILSIDEGYCMGCGKCADKYPTYYYMMDGKAVVKEIEDERIDTDKLKLSAESCPFDAIAYSSPADV